MTAFIAGLVGVFRAPAQARFSPSPARGRRRSTYIPSHDPHRARPSR